LTLDAGENVARIAVHTASRVAAFAKPGELVVPSTVKDLIAGSGLRFAERDTCPQGRAR
jgi:hypothetical protein